MRLIFLLITAALLWPVPGQAAPLAADPALFVSLVRLDRPTATVYSPQRITLGVLIATDSAERVPVWLDIDHTPALAREAGHYHPWMSFCDEISAHQLRCFPTVSASAPVTLSLDLDVRSWAQPGAITPTLQIWPMPIGPSARITETLPLTIIEPARVYVPIVAR